MTSDPARVDFSRLYAELGIAPAAGLDALKRAYRRRVAQLHPDRPAEGPRDPSRLIALNLGYAAVLDFHRRQGRLPGEPVRLPEPVTAAAPRRDSRAEPREASPDRVPRAGLPMRQPAAAPLRRSAPSIKVLAVPVVLAIAAIWHWFPEAGPRPATATGTAPSVPATTRPAAGHVQLGMDRGTVARLLGEPVARDGTDRHWVYGPSWLLFECDRLVDWYSSPLRPLRVGSRRPGQEERAAHASRGTCIEPHAGLAGSAKGD